MLTARRLQQKRWRKTLRRKALRKTRYRLMRELGNFDGHMAYVGQRQRDARRRFMVRAKLAGTGR